MSKLKTTITALALAGFSAIALSSGAMAQKKPDRKSVV